MNKAFDLRSTDTENLNLKIIYHDNFGNLIGVFNCTEKMKSVIGKNRKVYWSTPANQEEN